MHCAPAGDRNILSSGGELATGIIDEHIDPAVRGERLINEAAHLLGFANVADHDTTFSANPMDEFGGSLEWFLPTTSYDQAGTCGRCRYCGRPADSGAPARDEHNLTGERLVMQAGLLGAHADRPLVVGVGVGRCSGSWKLGVAFISERV